MWRPESSLHTEFVTLGPPVLIPLSGLPGSLLAPCHSGASSIRGSNRPKSPRRTVQRPSSVTAAYSVPARDLETQPARGRLLPMRKGTSRPCSSAEARCQCPWSSGVMNMSSKYVDPYPPSVTVAPGHEGVDASCSVCSCHANAGRRSLQQHPCGRRLTVATRPSRILANGDQTRYCTGDAPLVALEIASPSALALHILHD